MHGGWRREEINFRVSCLEFNQLFESNWQPSFDSLIGATMDSIDRNPQDYSELMWLL